jgi:C-terminal processing protease CtpA/Prc
MQNGKPVVVRTLPGGPAAQAGVLPLDVVTDVDGRGVSGLGLGDVVMLLRGAPDTQVALGVRRAQQRLILILRRQALHKGETDYQPTTAPPAIQPSGAALAPALQKPTPPRRKAGKHRQQR